MEQPRSFKGVRVGVFDTVKQADEAVYRLREAGFSQATLERIRPRPSQQVAPLAPPLAGWRWQSPH